MNDIMKEFVETLNKEIANKAKAVQTLVWDYDNPDITKFIKDKVHEIDQLIDIRTKLMQ